MSRRDDGGSPSGRPRRLSEPTKGRRCHPECVGDARLRAARTDGDLSQLRAEPARDGPDDAFGCVVIQLQNTVIQIGKDEHILSGHFCAKP